MPALKWQDCLVWISLASSSSLVLATKGGKVINWKDPLKEDNPQERRHELEGRGFESRYRQNIFSHQISVKVYWLWTLYIKQARVV